MTLRLLSGFKSLETYHCVTGSMRHVYVYNDHDISEDMLLGIGAGVSFGKCGVLTIPGFYGIITKVPWQASQCWQRVTMAKLERQQLVLLHCELELPRYLGQKAYVHR